MVLREGTRRWSMRVAWTALCISVALLLGLRLGRPLYYTDGRVEVPASALRAAGMLRWNTPEVELELPGPVAGRVAVLPDGRLVYGRLGADGTSDLVCFDGERPDVAPEPLYELASPDHEVAPAVDADGNLWFASDRPGGSGGYDLYLARRAGAGFSPPEPVVACNTPFDETDPAPTPDGQELVFVRIDRRHERGDDGVLYRWRRDGATEAAPVFAPPPRAGALVQRDPAFAADGAALWFVQKQGGGRLSLVRATFAAGEFDAPQPIDGDWGTGELRSPLPAADGRTLRLWSPRRGEGSSDLCYRATAQELLPWWPAQRWLEWLLFGVATVAGIVLVLLHLGRRWATLDLVAQCLLLSLLLHVLLFSWLMGVELLGAEPRDDDDGGGMEVHLVSTVRDDDAERGGAAAAAVVAAVAFQPAERAFAVAAPGAGDLPVAGGALAAPAGERGEAPTAQVHAAAEVEVADAASVLPRRDGQERAAALAATAAPGPDAPAASPAREAARALRQSAADEPVVVTVPGSTMAAAAAGSVVAAPNAVRTVATPIRATPAAPTPALADADATAAPARDGADLAGSRPEPVAATTTAPAPDAAAAAVAPPVAATAALAAAAPASRVARNAAAPRHPAGGEPAPPLLPTASRHRQAPPALQDTALAAAAAPARAGAIEAAATPGMAAAELPTVAPRTATELAAGARPQTGAVVPPPLTTAPAPASDLRGAAARHAAPAAAPPAAPPVARHTRPAAPVLHEAAAPRVHTPPAVAAGAAEPRAAGVPVAVPATVVAPAGNAAATAAMRGLAGASTMPAATAPNSTLPRKVMAVPAATGAPMAAAAAAPRRPAPVPLAGSLPDGLGPKGAARPLDDGRRPAVYAVPVVLATPAGEPATTVLRDGRAFAGDERPLAIVVTPPASRLPRAAPAPQLPQAAMAVAGSAYSNRFGPAKAKALATFGGSEATERAVADGLRYLARSQNADGSWGNRERFDDKYGEVSVGKSALCLLAFLGAGHTDRSASEHSPVVARALRHLLSLQDEATGAFGVSSAYGHGITTYALAECFGMTKDPALLPPLERALTWILDNQGPRRDRRNRGGWGYFSPGLTREDDYARVSVSAWMVMALESARLSGIELPEDVLPRAREYFELAFDAENGWFRYNHKPSRLNSAWPTLPASTPAGGFCSLLLGVAKDDARVQAAVEYTVARRPVAYRRYDDDDFVVRGQGNVYFWYYGSLCCFLAGGDAWRQWNERLSSVLPAAQAKDGSFPPIDTYAELAGDNRRDRSYTTAMCVLCLEVYYRYFTPLLLGR